MSTVEKTVPIDEVRRRAEEPTADYLRRLRAMGLHTPTRRMIKTPEQIAGCREAGRINSLILDAVEQQIRVGMTTAEIDDIVTETTRRLGGKPACLGFEGYPRAVCTSVNEVICHGIPDPRTVLRPGDIVNVDCTTEYGGYFGDASRLFTFDPLPDRTRSLVQTVRESVELAVRHIRPYTSHLGDIGYYIDSLARSRGFSVVADIGGHGVGLKMHEDPYVCHIGRLGEGMILLPGMIFTVEPMINAGTDRFTVDRRDGWTVRTADGKPSAQVEYEVLVTEEGVEILSR